MDLRPRERIIKVLLALLSQPNQYTLKQLSERYGERSTDRVKSDINILRNAGIDVDYDKRYRYFIIPDNSSKALKYLQALTDEDKALISRSLNKTVVSSIEVKHLQNKLDSLYDFQQLGLEALRRPALEKLERLRVAQQSKKLAIFKNYKSNSNTVKDRKVEVFHIEPEYDTVQVFDVDNEGIRHFRISRIERIVLSDEDWQFEGHHSLKHTDVFRIASKNPVLVQLLLDVYAYNALIENYPRAKARTIPGIEPNTWDFQTKVNSDFLGLMNFIMSNARHVTIFGPETLKQRVREEAENILEKIKKNMG